MNLNKKAGITLASLVVYIVLFTSFTIFVSLMSTNMNERLFDNRGEAINYSSLNKLQLNIENSGLDSNSVVVNSNEISYSNGDNYIYDETQQVIFKNGGILCLNVQSFSASVEQGVNTQKVTVEVTFNKYLNVLSKSIVSCVEGV